VKTAGALLLFFGVASGCARRVDAGAAGGALDASRAAPGASVPTVMTSAGVPDAASHVVDRLRFGNQSKTGGVDLTITRDGTATGSYMNAGFSSAGAEIVPIQKTLPPARVTAIFAAAKDVADAIPAARESPDPAWHGSGTLDVHFGDGGELLFVWPGEGAHADPRVKRLADLVQQVL
jgi:hypothetical protein